ncbi:unnamed protein product [Nippostrongylus brasiliensis]|uniref:Mariner Mos1 transposase n=1 Tax=Nippostrongylus brasiliensis TaxID=27835 RepID=A0A0N4YEW0_NIPBR|nr:unnamed protein product [Nippostrongylus brasiliensis]
MSKCKKDQSFIDSLYKLLDERQQEALVVYSLETTIYNKEQSIYRTERKGKKEGKVEHDEPLSVDFVLSKSSTTVSKAIYLRKITERMKTRRQLRLRLTSDLQSEADSHKHESSDTDPETQGLAGFEAAAFMRGQLEPFCSKVEALGRWLQRPRGGEWSDIVHDARIKDPDRSQVKLIQSLTGKSKRCVAVIREPGSLRRRKKHKQQRVVATQGRYTE